jgi:hypothetical protein
MLKGPNQTDKAPAPPTFDSDDWSILAEIQQEEAISESSPRSPSEPEIYGWNSTDDTANEYGYVLPKPTPKTPPIAICVEETGKPN